MAKPADHIHKYQREKLGKLTIYRCMVPGCPHYVHQKLALGRLSVCHYCGDTFVMSKKSIKLKKPHCLNCHIAHNAKDRPEPKTAETFLKSILPDVVEK